MAINRYCKLYPAGWSKYYKRIWAIFTPIRFSNYDFDVKNGIDSTQGGSGDGKPVKAALPGNVLRVNVSVGDSVAEGDVIAVVEAMKMETEIKSPLSGTVTEVDIEVGGKVKTGDTLVVIA